MNAKWTLKMLKITLTQSVDIEQIHTLPVNYCWLFLQ